MSGNGKGGAASSTERSNIRRLRLYQEKKKHDKVKEKDCERKKIVNGAEAFERSRYEAKREEYRRKGREKKRICWLKKKEAQEVVFSTLQ